MTTTPSKISCSECGRPLSDPESIARGMGPDCAARAGVTGSGHALSALPSLKRGLRTITTGLVWFYRTMGGSVRSNVPTVTENASFSWGAKSTEEERETFALNILLQFTSKKRAYALAPRFADQFLARKQHDAGYEIPTREIRAWLKTMETPNEDRPHSGHTLFDEPCQAGAGDAGR